MYYVYSIWYKKNHTTIKLKKISIHSNILRANTHGTCYRRQGSFSEPSPCMSLYKPSVHRKRSLRPGPGSPPLCVRGVVWLGWWWPSLRGHIEPLYNTVRSLPPNDSTTAEKCKWDICRKSIVTSQFKVCYHPDKKDNSLCEINDFHSHIKMSKGEFCQILSRHDMLILCWFHS